MTLDYIDVIMIVTVLACHMLILTILAWAGGETNGKSKRRKGSNAE